MTFTPDETLAWTRISAHPFENPDISLDFTRRLAHHMGWSLEHARAGIEEYRRFCFLAAVGASPVTPSEEVDEIWHLHLTYSRDYWNVWCQHALSCRLHHDPTAGGPSEQARYRAQYADTLALYERYFGMPDPQFWPGTRDRFRARARYRVIDGDRVFVLPRPTWKGLRAASVPALAASLALVSAQATAAELLDVLDWKGDRFLSFYFPLLLGAFALAFVVRWLICATGRPAVARNLSPVEVAYVKDGVGRAADTLVIDLTTADAASVTATPPRVRISTARAALPRALQPYRSLEQGAFTRREFQRMFKEAPATRRMRDELIDGNLILDPGRHAWCTTATLLIVGPVLMLGTAKVILGVGRDKPVGILVTMLVVSLVALCLTAFRDRRVTREGRAAVATMRRQYDRAVRAPRPHEVPLAFAFAGATVLVGTEHAAYAAIISPPSSSGGSGSSGGDSGSSGCGGGGGCGGCGS